jgi:ribonuclease BN (tRNA processing enzyme)
VFTHRHPDHCADLVPLLFAMHTPPARTDDYRIWAGKGFAAYVDQLRAIYEGWITFGSDGRRGAIVREMSLDGPDAVDLGGLKLVTRPAKHSAGALHLRFEADGIAIVVSGDTGPSEALVELAKGAELLVCECSTSDARPLPLEGHMTPGAVADFVAKARPREVWLTHLFGHVNAAEAFRTVAKAGAKVRRPNDLQIWEP